MDVPTTPVNAFSAVSRRPKRADARRNYDSLISAARDVFAEDGVAGSLEEIARRANVGIGTLYRHFPTRGCLFESVYIDEVAALCQAADDLCSAPPWDALVAWLNRLVQYAGVKRMLSGSLSHDSPLGRTCRDAFYSAGERLLRRAQEAGVARRDVDIDDVARLIGGVALMHFPAAGQQERVVGLAVDGLRNR